MSERSSLGVNPATTTSMATLTLEEPGAEHQASPRAPGPLRCGPCALWPRQQTWLCAVPLLMGFVGLGLSLMLLKWIVVGSVQDYVPTDLVDAKGIGQDPFFLSKPSALPKGADTTTTTTTVVSTGGASSSTTPNAATASTGPPVVTGSPSRAANGTASVQRTRTGPPANHTRGRGSTTGVDEPRYPNFRAPGSSSGGGSPGSGAAAPTTMTTTTTTTTTTAPKGSPKESTNRRGGGAGGGRIGPPPDTTTTTTTTNRAPTTTSTVAAPAKPTSRWNHGRSSKGSSTTRPHHRFRTPPTNPTPRSEHFKRCQDKDLAFCLNEGECFIIETVAGVHRHCRCKEGYHGLRCDQFVPKTDAILSDPTDELGIEFMESNETYQRQVLSIFSIAMGISFLGVACMALYCRNKRLREKHRTHLAESRHLRDCSVNASGLMSKSSPRPQSGLQSGLQQHCCKAYGSSPPHGGSLEPCCSAVCPANQLRVSPKGKRLRSKSLSVSPSQKRRSCNNRSASHWTPPIGRTRHNLIGGARDSGHAYRHLQEVETPETESLKRCKSLKEEDKEPRQPSLNMQTGDLPVQAREGWRGLARVPCTRLDKGTASSSPSFSSSSSSSSSSSPSLSTSASSSHSVSVPIIPFVQGHGGRAPGPGERRAVRLGTDSGSADCSATVLGSVPETPLGSAEAAVSHSQYHHHHNHHHHHHLLHHHALVVGPSGGAGVGSGVTSKHKSLVTYTTASGSGTGTAHVSTVVSAVAAAVTPAVQGPGAPSKQQHPARPQPAGARRPHSPAQLPALPPHMGGKKAEGSGPRDFSVSSTQRDPSASAKHRDGSATATTAHTS
ncbi:pro-neuregulin-3, membrane-bound isoform isoform X2 [Alosa sapidissima]|uniref:pro-neuregulin-3, membrane-bound isoform isoform X2 n=1 Tax=Alosa sapidissima TaxID=34773 RepID=UPI001C091E0E|nr:pro-neuregulin-3, membrane-bound isoform isoform X2 [Alosa sapidissima]